MARKKQEVETAIAVPDDGTVRGSKFTKRSQPSETHVAFRSFAQGLAGYFSRVENGQEGDAAALRAFQGYDNPPWEMRSRTEYRSMDDVKLVALITVLDMEDWEEYPEWKQKNPLYQMPPSQAFIYEVEKGARSLNRAGLWEELQFGTGIIAPDLLRATQKKRD